MNYLQEGLYNTLHTLKTRKLLLSTLVILQLLLVFIYAQYIILPTQVKLIAAAQGTLAPLQNANYDATSIDAGKPFLQDIALVEQNGRKLFNIFYSFLAWTLFLLFIPYSWLWIGSHLMLQEQKPLWETTKTMMRYWLKYIVVSLIILVIFTGITLLMLKNLFFQENPEELITHTLNTIGSVFILLYGIWLITLTCISLPTWKLLFINLKKLTTKLHYILLVLLINIAIIGVILAALYYTLADQTLFTIMFLLTILLIIVLPLTRLFWIASIHQLIKHE